MSKRTERVNETLRKELAQLIIEAATGDLPMMAVDRVETAPDLKSAKVYVSLVTNHERNDEMIQFLELKRIEFQQAIARNGNLKFTPVLDFRISHFDENLENVESLIKKINES